MRSYPRARASAPHSPGLAAPACLQRSAAPLAPTPAPSPPPAVVGKGGHAAMPHTVVDPVVAAAGVVRAVQTIVSREVDPLESAVVSVTKFHAGEAFNVIPDEALLGGTIRSLSVEGMQRLMKRFEEIVQLVRATDGARSRRDSARVCCDIP